MWSFSDHTRMLCKGEYGVNGLFVGVPVKLGRRGVEEVVKLDPDDAYSHHNLAVLCFRLGDLTRARAHVNRAIALGVTPHPEFIAALEAAERRRFLPARPRATSRARP